MASGRPSFPPPHAHSPLRDGGRPGIHWVREWPSRDAETRWLGRARAVRRLASGADEDNRSRAMSLKMAQCLSQEGKDSEVGNECQCAVGKANPRGSCDAVEPRIAVPDSGATLPCPAMPGHGIVLGHHPRGTNGHSDSVAGKGAWPSPSGHWASSAFPCVKRHIFRVVQWSWQALHCRRWSTIDLG